ncbi:hypothetical protein [Patulibacter minatonensis]|uniref:hypothetical protein n=1 Tax=Patulibacter minatonensis TaxID=298163 RepID=UPI0004794F47|nr:hypothetical protein [Patulibacter minatonensis]
MLLAIVMGLLAVASLVAFVVPLRIATRNEAAVRERGMPAHDGTAFVGLDHLAIGVELQFDRQRWFVRGVQHVTPEGGEAWSAWHLDDRGQGGWLQTAGRDDEVVFAVRAERPDTLDPGAERLTWRNHEWVRLAADAGPVDATGERQRSRRGGLQPVSDADVERVVFTREEMPSRRLVLERSADDETWNAWIGTAVPGRMVDVWPPGGAAATVAGPQPS